MGALLCGGFFDLGWPLLTANHNAVMNRALVKGFGCGFLVYSYICSIYDG